MLLEGAIQINLPYITGDRRKTGNARREMNQMLIQLSVCLFTAQKVIKQYGANGWIVLLQHGRVLVYEQKCMQL